jgi:hypothetical protein
MRLWSFHPKYLDSKGIVALWREALLAQKVLQGKTKGYRHHPQLERFKNSGDPARAITFYLYGVWEEADRRGYHFDKRKIQKKRAQARIRLTRGQMKYEFDWLCEKLKKRDPVRYGQIKSMMPIKAHPLFFMRPGPVESWERVRKG